MFIMFIFILNSKRAEWSTPQLISCAYLAVNVYIIH